MTWHDWLPSTQQMSNAIQLRSDPYHETSMRQALGMIWVMGMVAGLLPFLVNWAIGAGNGGPLPIAIAAREVRQTAAATAPFGSNLPFSLFNMAAWNESVQTLAGLEQPLPDWLAAGLTALGYWLNVPLAWLQLWLVYGFFVLVVAKLLGADSTSQRFFAATGYFAVPMGLSGLTVIPYVGWLVGLVVGVWAVVVYGKAVSEITRLDRLKTIVSVLVPAVVALLVAMVLSVGFLLVLTSAFRR